MTGESQWSSNLWSAGNILLNCCDLTTSREKGGTVPMDVKIHRRRDERYEENEMSDDVFVGVPSDAT